MNELASLKFYSSLIAWKKNYYALTVMVESREIYESLHHEYNNKKGAETRLKYNVFSSVTMKSNKTIGYVNRNKQPALPKAKEN